MIWLHSSTRSSLERSDRARIVMLRQLKSRCGLGLLIAAAAVACEDSTPLAESEAIDRETSIPPTRVMAPGKPSLAERRTATGQDIPGRFRPAREQAGEVDLSDEQREMVRELEAIGYLSGTEQARGSGITIHDRERAQTGLNFFASGHAEGATLMDMDGKVLHRWEFRFPDAFETPPLPHRGKRDQWWRRAFLLPNGDVIAIITGSGVMRIDKDSKLIWAKAIYAHHDLAFEPNGDMWVMTRKVHIVPRINVKQPIVEDTLTLLDSEGNEKEGLSLLTAFENSKFARIWLETGRRSGDLFHSNSIERLDGRAARAHPAFKEGNLLISFLGLDAIAIVDPLKQKVVWAHSGEYHKQHDPKILANGNLMLFDNQAFPRPSAVLEYELPTMRKVWEFRGSPSQPFYSKSLGTAQRLENGNTLISESDFGRAFEVTPDGDIVWEFHNPQHAGEDDRFVAALPEMIRLPPDFATAWLDQPAIDSDPP
jgi:hypothetical protein